MVRILREADQTSVAKAARKHGVSEQTLYTWRKRFTGMEVADVKQLKKVEVENARLKKLLAERDLTDRAHRLWRTAGSQVPQDDGRSTPPAGPTPEAARSSPGPKPSPSRSASVAAARRRSRSPGRAALR